MYGVSLQSVALCMTWCPVKWCMQFPYGCFAHSDYQRPLHDSHCLSMAASIV